MMIPWLLLANLGTLISLSMLLLLGSGWVIMFWGLATRDNEKRGWVLFCLGVSLIALGAVIWFLDTVWLRLT